MLNVPAELLATTTRKHYPFTTRNFELGRQMQCSGNAEAYPPGSPVACQLKQGKPENVHCVGDAGCHGQCMLEMRLLILQIEFFNDTKEAPKVQSA